MDFVMRVENGYDASVRAGKRWSVVRSMSKVVFFVVLHFIMRVVVTIVVDNMETYH